MEYLSEDTQSIINIIDNDALDLNIFNLQNSISKKNIKETIIIHSTQEKKRICYAINNQFKKILLEASDEKKSELSSDIEKIENELNTCQDLSLNTIKIISENSENLRHLLKKS